MSSVYQIVQKNGRHIYRISAAALPALHSSTSAAKIGQSPAWQMAVSQQALTISVVQVRKTHNRRMRPARSGGRRSTVGGWTRSSSNCCRSRKRRTAANSGPVPSRRPSTDFPSRRKRLRPRGTTLKRECPLPEKTQHTHFRKAVSFRSRLETRCASRNSYAKCRIAGGTSCPMP